MMRINLLALPLESALLCAYFVRLSMPFNHIFFAYEWKNWETLLRDNPFTKYIVIQSSLLILLLFSRSNFCFQNDAWWINKVRRNLCYNLVYAWKGERPWQSIRNMKGKHQTHRTYYNVWVCAVCTHGPHSHNTARHSRQSADNTT